MEDPDICGPLEEFILRLEQRHEAAQNRGRDLQKMLDKFRIDAEFGEPDPSQAERCRSELEQAAKEEADAAEAIRWSWRLRFFVDGTRASVAPPKMLRALEALDASAARDPAGKPNGKASRICSVIESALREHGPLHRQRLLEILVDRGVMGQEAKPINRLATILTENRHLFSSDGRGTYALAASGLMEQRRVTEATGLSGPSKQPRPAPQPQPGGERAESTYPL